MGVEPFLVASAVNCIVAQRLARRICPECIEVDEEISAEDLIAAGLSESECQGFVAKHGKGCSNCSDTGYKGRIAIYEVMSMTEELKEFVLNGASAAEIKREAIRSGMMTLRRSALNKLLEETTTLSEVFRVSASD